MLAPVAQHLLLWALLQGSRSLLQQRQRQLHACADEPLLRQKCLQRVCSAVAQGDAAVAVVLQAGSKCAACSSPLRACALHCLCFAGPTSQLWATTGFDPFQAVSARDSLLAVESATCPKGLCNACQLRKRCVIKLLLGMLQ